MNSIVLIGALSQVIYLIIFKIENLLYLSWNNLLFAALMLAILYFNHLKKQEIAKILFFSSPVLLLNFTYLFGNIGAEYVEFIVIVSTLFFLNTFAAIMVSLYAALFFVLAKVMIAYLDFPDLHWAGPLFYYINLAVTTTYTFIFIYIYKTESEEQQNEIEKTNLVLSQKNRELELLYSMAL